MKIKRLKCSDIPKEFQISTYDACESWGVDEWAFALSVRRSMRLHWKLACSEGKNESVPQHMLNRIQEDALKLLIQPLVVDRKVNLFIDRQSSIRDQSVSDFFGGYFAFSDPHYSEWAEMYSYLMFYKFAVNEGGVDVIDSDEDKKIQSNNLRIDTTAAWKMDRERMAFPNKFFISVDLGASDQSLVKEFKTWIKRTRIEAGIESIRRPFNKNDFMEWREQRLLPYLDLTFWAATQRASFTQATIANALFPSYDDLNEDVVAKVRKTVAPNALGIVSDEVVSAMNGQMRN